MIGLSNGAGICKTVEDVELFSKFAVTAVTVGSVTRKPREGNPGENLYVGEGYSINSLGLPNPGWEYYREHLSEMAEICRREDKRLRLSVAGFTVEELVYLTQIQEPGIVDEIELNLGCPNVWSDGTHHRIMGYDPSAVQVILPANRVKGISIHVKMPPVFDSVLLAELADVINLSGAVVSVTAINTIPNAYSQEIGMRLGGYSGRGLLPIGLGQVIQWRSLLVPWVGITGVGGIEDPGDALWYVYCGADAVQITTGFLVHGGDVFYRVFYGLNANSDAD
jgi:dihydroorotate dehydrogenase (fumarate)